MPLDWIQDKKDSNGHKLLTIIPILDSIDDIELYITNFVDALKESAIMLNREAFNYCFLPFMIQVGVCVAYFSFYALDEHYKRTIISTILEIFVCLTTAYFLFIEFLQLRAQRKRYF